MKDPPPVILPDEKASVEELAKIARDLLRDAAGADPEIAAKMRGRGIKRRTRGAG